ncbi:uncharacterized protein BDV17DRAFT_113116 [Aspergillus undulatus]|uniref:uncharacterized protein n=1 Tax=Aspergillus undulatus TaxID=1810928 RepID=UPI003CCD85AD
MDPSRNFKSIINSVPFTFLVGPNHTKLTIQSGLARHVSKPLDHLINSGKTRESRHQIAILEDEDVETFVAFCEYAYTGDYEVPPPGSREDEREQDSINPALNGMFPGETGASTPAVNLPQSPRQPTEAFDDEAAENTLNAEDNKPDDGAKNKEQDGVQSQQPGQKDEQAWNSSMEPESRPLDQTDTPRETDQSPASSVDASHSRGRRRRRGKTNEQGFIEDPAAKLTPPRTPPGAARVESEKNPAAELAGSPHALADIHQPTTVMEYPAPSFGNGLDESGYEGDLHRQENSTRSRVRPVIDTSFANQQFSPRHEKGTTLWDAFTGIDDTDFRSPNCKARPSNPLPAVALPYLIFHAKLYVFATRYLIPNLAQLCLQKLHRDLLNLAFPDPDPDNQYAEQLILTTTKARMIVDLLNYTYTKTTRLEPITPSSATQLRDNELRRLVVHYAACKVRDLAMYCPPTEPVAGSTIYPVQPSARGFRALLNTLPELASDLIYRMI